MLVIFLLFLYLIGKSQFVFLHTVLSFLMYSVTFDLVFDYW